MGSLARTPFDPLRCGGGYDPMDRPYRIRGLRNGSTFFHVVISWFSRTYELELLAGGPRIMVLGL
jgi:hypothetical protein